MGGDHPCREQLNNVKPLGWASPYPSHLVGLQDMQIDSSEDVRGDAAHLTLVLVCPPYLHPSIRIALPEPLIETRSAWRRAGLWRRPLQGIACGPSRRRGSTWRRS
jgi:hypothetical protein